LPDTAVRPVPAQYLPGGHCVQDGEEAPESAKEPAGHGPLTPSGAERPAIEQYLPASQGVHRAEPAEE
jgi:hypothetical protein